MWRKTASRPSTFSSAGDHYADAPRPDLILLDLNLPKRDGREVLEEIRADGDLTEIPIVILTTSQADEDVARAYRLHANCYHRQAGEFQTVPEGHPGHRGLLADRRETAEKTPRVIATRIRAMS